MGRSQQPLVNSVPASWPAVARCGRMARCGRLAGCGRRRWLGVAAAGWVIARPER